MGKGKKHAWWVTLIIVACIAGVVVGGIFYANHLLTGIVNNRLKEQVKNMKNVSVGYDTIEVDIWRGSAFVKNLRYCSNALNELPDTVPGFIVEAKLAQFQFLSYLSYLKKKDIAIGRVVVSDVSAYANYAKKDTAAVNPEKVLIAGSDTIHVTATDTINMTKSGMEATKSILAFVASINVNRIEVCNGMLRFRDLDNKMEADCDSLYLKVRNLGYDFATDSISYNDSVYTCSIKNIRFVHPDGKYTLTVDHLYSKNTKNITIKGVKHVCNVPKQKLAVVNGKVPVVWSYVAVDEIKTSKLNIVRTIIDQNVDIDHIDINGGTVILYQDKTYPPTHVQRPYQVLLNSINMPFNVNVVSVNLDHFSYTYTSAMFPPSTINMNTMEADVRRISNRDPQEVIALAKCSLDGGGGFMALNIRMFKDKECTWKEHIVLENSNLKALNGFLRNIAGAEVAGRVHKMECRATGDTLTAEGTFVMEYKGLEAKVIKGKSPIKILNENSKFVNGLVKVVVPVANPMKPGDKPKAYRVKGKRDLYAPYMVYMLSPMFKGLEETMLAPFYLHKEIKTPQKKAAPAKSTAKKK